MLAQHEACRGWHQGTQMSPGKAVGGKLLTRGMAGAAPGSQNENIPENYLRTEEAGDGPYHPI